MSIVSWPNSCVCTRSTYCIAPIQASTEVTRVHRPTVNSSNTIRMLTWMVTTQKGSRTW